MVFPKPTPFSWPLWKTNVCLYSSHPYETVNFIYKLCPPACYSQSKAEEGLTAYNFALDIVPLSFPHSIYLFRIILYFIEFLFL